MLKPRQDLKPNTAAYETEALVKPTGFREYDARWLFPEEINLMGLNAVGLGLAELFDQRGVKKRIVVGHDYRAYSLTVKQALTLGRSHTVVSWLHPLERQARQQLEQAARQGKAQSLNISLG